MKNIYIVLPRSETFIAKIARKITRYEYSHVTISLEDSLETFYSLSRIYNKAPIISGFVKESRADLSSRKNVDLKCKIFKIKTSDEKYKEIVKYIKKIEEDKKYMFNYISMILVTINNGCKINKAHNCCEFVSIVLDKLDVIKFDKPGYKFTPKDFDEKLSKKYFYFEGYLKANNYKKNIYFKNIKIVKKYIYSIRLIIEIVYRLIFKRCSNKFDNSILYTLHK